MKVRIKIELLDWTIIIVIRFLLFYIWDLPVIRKTPKNFLKIDFNWTSFAKCTHEIPKQYVLFDKFPKMLVQMLGLLRKIKLVKEYYKKRDFTKSALPISLKF